jgi:hypothetical protein
LADAVISARTELVVSIIKPGGESTEEPEKITVGF